MIKFISYYTFKVISIITFFLLNESIIGMDEKKFQTDCPGRLVKIPEGVYAFVPTPLPPSNLQLDLKIINLLSEANQSLGELKGVASNLPNPYFLIGPLRAREAILSSKLEGTITTAEELIMYEAQGEKGRVRDETREVSNYIKAMEYGLARLKELPLSNRLIREVHAKLMEDVRGQEYSPGEFRKHQNYIGMKGQKIEDGRFVPPPVLDMIKALSDLESFFHDQNELPPLVKLAIIHYQFETIHPFMDGNGRIGRLLITLMLCDWKQLGEPLLYMSSYFERNKDLYMDLLFAISQKGAWIEWIEFFLRGVIIQSLDAIIRVKKLLMLQSQYRQKIQTIRTSALQLKLVDELFLSPWTTMSRAADVMGITRMSAQNNINKLVKAGILRESTGRPRDRVYIATGIIEIINRDSFDKKEIETTETHS